MKALSLDSSFLTLVRSTARTGHHPLVARVRRAVSSPAAQRTVLAFGLCLLSTGAFAQSAGGSVNLGAFASMPDRVFAVVSVILRAALIVGGGVLGFKALLGSHETGKAATTYLIGAFIAVLVGAVPGKLWELATSMFGN